MNRREAILIAKTEAQRFLARVEAWEEAEAKHDWTNPKECGAVRRSSMDLTRALADLRRATW